MPADNSVSRRAWLKSIALLTAGLGTPPLLRSAAAVDTKAAKSLVHYRDYPKQMQMCGMCKFFEGHGMRGGGIMGCGMMVGGMSGEGMMAGQCQVVEGRISPMGWCDLYASRGA